MPQDYAKPRRPKKTPSQNRRTPSGSRIPGWTLLLGGFIAGILVSALSLYWYLNLPVSTGDSDAGEIEQTDVRPRFDFYTLLKESEIFVPETEEAPESQSPSEQFHYLLQAGSFRRFDDADGLRAQLLLLNLNASVETSNTKPGETWHRVLVGPFTSRSKAANARASLLQNGIDNILLKRKRG